MSRNPVGRFVGRCYPTQPGLYRFSPYRGEGHVRFLCTLERGEAAVCWFCRKGKKMLMTVVAEHFVRDMAGCHWLVDVSIIEEHVAS